MRGLLPVQRRGPSTCLDDLPSVRQPELGPGVSAIFHEREILAASDQTRCQAEPRYKNLVARRFIVKAEAARRGADFMQTFRVGSRLLRDSRLPRGLRQVVIRGPQRAGPECMLDVGNDQLLVLLLVIASQLNQPQRFLRHIAGAQHLQDVLIHVAAISHHFVQAGTRKCIAQRFFRLRSQRVVIGIEERLEAPIERPVSGHMLGKDKGLEEPARVRQMPLGGTGVGAGLHHLVFGAQRRSQDFRLFSHRGKLLRGSFFSGSLLPGNRTERQDFL